MDDSLEKYEEGLAPMVPFTSVCNAAGVPAMSVPLEVTEDGLPIGMHFVARYGAEQVLLSLAAQLEQAHPWRHRRPHWVN
jgi:amidase